VKLPTVLAQQAVGSAALHVELQSLRAITKRKVSILSAITFSRLRIGDAPAGYFSGVLWSRMAYRNFIRQFPLLSVEDVADLVLARAQLHLCQVFVEGEDGDATLLLRTFNTLADCRASIVVGEEA